MTRAKFHRFSAEEIGRERIKYLDCHFYHTTDIPETVIPRRETARGQWDLRGQEATYLGSVDFRDKSVLEFGCASGALSFWMESQGARVTGFDLGPHNEWDTVPIPGEVTADYLEERKKNIIQINNAWKFLHQAHHSSASYINGSIYDVDESLGRYDIVTLCSILLHLHDPFLAIVKAASLAQSMIVITEVSEELFLSGHPELQKEPLLYFIPKPAKRNFDAWYMLTSAFVKQALELLGFDVTISRHSQVYMDGHRWPYYTAVGSRRS